MPEPLFNVMAQAPAEGQAPEEVKTRIAAMYNNNLAKAETFFQGKYVTVKQAVDKDTALKFKKAFEKAGAVVKVTAAKVQPDSAAQAPAAKPKAAPKGPTVKCPKCGLEQPESSACLKCGLIFAKYHQAKGPAATAKDAPPQANPSAAASAAPPLSASAALAAAQAEHKAKAAAAAAREGTAAPVNPALAAARADFRAKAGEAAEGESVTLPPGMAIRAAAGFQEEEDREPINFFSALPTAISYPFKGNGLFIIISAVVLYTIVTFIPFGTIIFIIASGYYSSYMFKIINSTSDGDEKPPNWPDFSSFSDDVIMPLIKMIWVSIFCFTPAILAGIFISGPVALLVVLLGAVYYPMALLTVAMSGNFLALNPLVVIPAIGKTLVDYLICLVAFLLVIFFNYFFRIILSVDIPLVGTAIQTFLTLYFMMMEMRVLGLLYLAHEEDLNWYT